MARPRQVSDEEILSAARDCFVEFGPGVSTSVIALRLGISQPALFKRYGTKQELMAAALLPPEVPSFVAAIELGPDERPVPEQLLAFGRQFVAFFDEFAPRMATLRASGCDLHQMLRSRYPTPPPARALVALTSFLSTLKAQGRVGDIDPPAVALMMLGGLQGRTFFSHMLGVEVGGDADSYLRSMIDLLWRAIAPEDKP